VRALERRNLADRKNRWPRCGGERTTSSSVFSTSGRRLSALRMSVIFLRARLFPEAACD
jgi:hypothetical protein